MISFWEQQSFQSYDYLVIGGGIVGISTAISLKEKNRNLNVAVIERGMIPTGASTKNAGFACFGSPSELVADIGSMGKEKALKLVNSRWKGLTMLRERLGDNRIDFQNKGGYELITKDHEHIPDRLKELNQWLYPVFERNVFEEKKKLINEFGINRKYFKTVIHNPLEGQLHSGMMMRSLLGYAQLLGIFFMNGTRVTSFTTEDKQVHVECFSDQQKVILKASKIAICTNAFARHLIPDLDIKPGRGLILLTEQLGEVPFQGTFHFDQGYYYFRDVQDRVLIGGGRNLDLKGEETEEFGINEKIYRKLLEQLEKNILGRKVKIEMEWSGIMAFGPDKEPIVQKVSPGVFTGVRMGGMGVAMGTMIGEELSNLLLNED